MASRKDLLEIYRSNRALSIWIFVQVFLVLLLGVYAGVVAKNVTGSSLLGIIITAVFLIVVYGTAFFISGKGMGKDGK